jgi:hypothetical protein
LGIARGLLGHRFVRECEGESRVKKSGRTNLPSH